MRKPENLPQIQQEYVGLMARVIQLADRGRNPDAGLLGRLYSLRQTLLRAGIAPERLLSEERYPGSGAAPVQGEGGPENNSQAGMLLDVHYNRVTEIGSGYISRRDTLAEGKLGGNRVLEKPLILGSSGLRLTEENIGGRCDLCQKWDHISRIYNCLVCHAPICLRHVRFFPSKDGRRIPMCPKHFRRAVRRMDMWEREDRHRGNK